MAINKKLIHFQTMANFEAQLSAGNILDTSIVFIKDAKKIWTHGEFYNCADGVDSVDWADIQNKPTIPTKTSELENDSKFLAESLTGYYISSLQLTGDLRNDIGDILKWSSTSKQLRVSDVGGDTIIRIYASGDGTKFLANDGKYKTALTEHQDISGKQDKTKCFNITPSAGNPLIVRPENNSYYSITNLANDIYVFLPDLLTPVTHVEHIMLNVKFGSNPNIQFIPGAGYGGTVRAAESFSIEPDSWYEISIINAGNGWVVSNIKLNDAIINPNLPSGNPTAVSSEEDELDIVEE